MPEHDAPAGMAQSQLTVPSMEYPAPVTPVGGATSGAGEHAGVGPAGADPYGASTLPTNTSVARTTQSAPLHGPSPLRVTTTTPAPSAPTGSPDDSGATPSSSLSFTAQTTYNPSTAMASLSVVTPPATVLSDPMLAYNVGHASHSPLRQQSQHGNGSGSAASATQSSGYGRQPSPPPLASAYVQPPTSTVTPSEREGDGWSMLPRTDDNYQGRDPAEPTNRRCVPTNSGNDPAFPDVAFGERASPAVISFQRAGARGHGRGASRALTPAVLSPARVDGSPNPSGLHRGGLRGVDENLELNLAHTDAASSPISTADGKSIAATDSPATPLVPPASRKLCVRHQRMADEGTTARLQKSIESLPLSDQTAVNTVWSLFSSSSHSRRALILQGILTMCCFSQLSLLSSELALAIRIDPFSLFPREVSLKVLGHLDAISLGRAAQVSKSWKMLADDDLLWRNMCEQHIERKCEKCGWGLPLLSERRRRVPGPGMQAGTPESRQLTIDPPSIDGHGHGDGSGAASPPSTGGLKRTITAAANAAALEKQSRSRAGSPSAISRHLNRSATSSSSDAEMNEGDGGDDGDGSAPPSKKQCLDGGLQPVRASAGQGAAGSKSAAYKTRPWKSVYCERLAIERNWRRGRYASRTLTGHTDGIMCLQFSEHLAHPAFPVVITGSYDRTARIWNLETGEQLRVLEGHTRGVRCLQFDEAKLITGSMDRTLKIWNWRTGALMRTLEGHTEGIVCLNFNEDTLASGSADSNIKIWNFRTGECYTLRGHHDWVNAVTLWTGPAAKERLRQRREAARSGNKASRLIRDDDPEAAGTFLFSASDDGTIRLWDLGLRECLLTFEGHVGQVQSLKLVMMDESAVKKLIGGAAGGPDAERDQRRDEPHGPRARQGPDTGADQDMMSVEDQESYFVNDRASVASVRQRQASASVRSSLAARDDTDRNGTNESCSDDAYGTGAAGIPDRFYHAAASGQHRTAIVEAQRRRRRKIDPTLARLQERLCAAGLVDPLPLDAEMGDLDMALSGDEQSSSDEQRQAGNGRRSGASSSKQANGSHHPRQRPVLISGSLDNTLKVWDVRTGRCIRTLFGHVEGVWSLDVDKLRVVSASHDRTIKIWDRDSGFCQNTLVGHRGAVTCLSLGDDKIVSGSDDGDIKVWSFAAAQQQPPFDPSQAQAQAQPPS